MKFFLCQCNPTVADLEANQKKVLHFLQKAKEKGAEVVVFPEMALCGYPPEDLLFQKKLFEKVEKSLKEIAPFTSGCMVILGAVRQTGGLEEKKLYNTAVVFVEGKLLGYKDKTLLPTYDVFEERRYFEPGKQEEVFLYKGKRIGVLVCEDIWAGAEEIVFSKYQRNPIEELAKKKPDYVVNISSSPYHYDKMKTRKALFAFCVEKFQVPFLWCNQVGASDDLVFDGYSLFMNEKKEILKIAKGFEEDLISCDISQKNKAISVSWDPLEALFSALVLGVKDYFYKQGFSKALIGLSGGIDSALVASVAKEALGKENVEAFFLPSRFTSLQSIEEVKKLARKLSIQLEELSIDSLFSHFLSVLSPYFCHTPFDVTEENLQARIRGILLMAFSNKWGALLLSASNKSEMAMGYSTLYGDMCGGLGVIQDLTKTKVYQLANWLEKKGIIPRSLIEKAPSAELRENQKDEDTLPPYEILDPIIEDYVENLLSVEEIAQKQNQELSLVQEIAQKIARAEYKRRQAPLGIRVSKRAFGKGRRVPVVQKWEEQD